MCIICMQSTKQNQDHAAIQAAYANATVDVAAYNERVNEPQEQQEWWINDQTPDNPFGKSEDYEAYLDYLGDLNRSLTPEIASEPLKINVSELSNHPEYMEAAIGALEMWASVTPLEFEIITDEPYDRDTQWMEVVSPEVGENINDGRAFSSNRFVSVGQRFHDTEPNITDLGGYVFNTYVHEFGHEFGLNHPGLYNYGGAGGIQITYLNNATWIYDRQQYSMMSYFDGIDVGETTAWTAVTPLMADIEAAIRNYFATEDENGEWTYQTINLNTEDDTYGFNSDKYGYELKTSGPQHDIGYVIHDTGGDDTIDFSGSSAGTILDLRAGQFSSVNGHNNNVSIFAGHNADETEYYIEKGIGSAHGDVLIGNDGDNVLDGRAGNDSMAGNAGDDTYFVDSIDDIVREEADGGNDTIVVLTEGLDIGEVENVENIIYAGGSTPQPDDTDEDGEDPDSGNTLGSIIYGKAVNDTLDGGEGGQTIFGLDGDDLITGGRDSLASRDVNNTIAIEDLEDQTESNDGNDALYGGKGNDTINGGQGDDTLDGGDGDDVLRGQAGVDVFRGGAGSDTVDYTQESPFQLIVNLETNMASGGTASGDTFDSIENLIGSDDRIDRFIGTGAANHFIGQGGGDYFSGRDGNDTLDGGRDGDIIYGEGGDDYIIGGSEQDYLDGGEGNDTVDYKTSISGVKIDLANGMAEGGDGTGPVLIVGVGQVFRNDILAGFENAVGSIHSDTLIGDDQDNLLSGDRGDDFLSGGAGNDTLDGGAGSDTADYSGLTEGASLNLKGDKDETYISIENLSGTAFNDRLQGDRSDNILRGQGGADTINGGGGDDTLLGDYGTIGAPLPTPVMGDGYATLGADATNNSIATAFDISDNFSLQEDADILDSTTIPHMTVNATGNGKAGHYRIDLEAGTTIRLDIDGIADPDVHDSWIRLLDSNGNIVAENDDGGGDAGSTSTRDSGLVYNVLESDTYYIVEGRWSPEADAWEEAVPEGSAYELNVSVEFPEPPADLGTPSSDKLHGGAGNDLLDGGLGNDTLTGAKGADSFRFSTELRWNNVDRVRDFDSDEDTFILDSSIFDEIGAKGVLSFGTFHQSSAGTAQDAGDRIIYNSRDGGLYYDSDGSGAEEAMQFAHLNKNLDLSADDFIII